MTDYTTDDDTPLDPKQWRILTDRQRNMLIEQMYITHYGLLPVFEEFKRIVARAQESETWIPYGYALLGESGVGKTAAVQHWMKTALVHRDTSHPVEQRPYLYISLPPAVTNKGLLSDWLAALGDPSWKVGTQWDMEKRLRSFIKAQHVQLVCIDNLHHLVHRETGRVLYEYVDFLEQIIIPTEIAAVFIGHPGTTEALLRTSPRLQRCIESVRYFRPFEWDRQRLQTIKEFRMLLRAIDQALPLDPSSLDEEEIAYSLFYATDGNPGCLFELIRAAASKAVHAHAENLNRPLLADTYDERSAAMERREKVNPFSTPDFREA